MDIETFNKIQEVIPLVSAQLGVVGQELYEKILWYIKVSKIITSVRVASFLLISSMVNYVIYRVLRKEDWEKIDLSVSSAVFATNVFTAPVILLIVLLISDCVVGMVYPEYVVIGMVLSKVGIYL